MLLLLLRVLFRREKLIGSLVGWLIQTYTLNVNGDVIWVLLVHF